MKFLDICSGIGGFRSGLGKAGHECIGYIEIDKYARQSYEAMYDTSSEWTGYDIRDVRANELPKADIWCFGFPCQDISVAGKRKGLNGARSGIFYDIIELLESQSSEDKPEWLLIENVKNLLSIDDGRGFEEVLVALDKAGYDAEWTVLNSKDFGVPQNRERVYIIGHLRDRGRRLVLFESGTGGQTPDQTESLEANESLDIHCLVQGRTYQNYVQADDGLSRTITARDYKDPQKIAIPKVKTIAEGSHQKSTVQDSDGLSKSLIATDYKDPQKVAIPKEDFVPKVDQIIPGDQAHRVYDSDGLSVTVKAEGGGVGAKSGLYAVPKEGNKQLSAVPCLTPDRLNKRQNGRRFKEPEDPMFTLTAQDRHGVLLYNDKEYYIRRLTPRECFRLQGFTDEQFDKAQEVCSNTQLYKQAGNAVTVNVAEYLGGLIK